LPRDRPGEASIKVSGPPRKGVLPFWRIPFPATPTLPYFDLVNYFSLHCFALPPECKEALASPPCRVVRPYGILMLPKADRVGPFLSQVASLLPDLKLVGSFPWRKSPGTLSFAPSPPPPGGAGAHSFPSGISERCLEMFYLRGADSGRFMRRLLSGPGTAHRAHQDSNHFFFPFRPRAFPAPYLNAVPPTPTRVSSP